MKSTPHVPETNKLPLKLGRQGHIAQSGESNVWEVTTLDSKGQERLIVLKQIRRDAFATDEEMRASKQFYEFLKAFPRFGQFVPDTLYFKARMTAEDPPKAFAIQKYLQGRTIDRIPDDELYKEPARSGSVCLNNIPRFISGLRANYERCRVVHGGGRRLRRTDRRGGQLGAHRGLHLTRPASLGATFPGTFRSA